jgi:hypothetical protein
MDIRLDGRQVEAVVFRAGVIAHPQKTESGEEQKRQKYA